MIIHEPRFAWEIFLEAGYELPITLEELPSDPLVLETAKYAISTMHRPNPRVAINYALTFYNAISPKSIRTNRGSSSFYFIFYGETAVGKTSSFKFFHHLLRLTIPEFYSNNAHLKTNEGFYRRLQGDEGGRLFLFYDEVSEVFGEADSKNKPKHLSLIHISEPTRPY